MDSPFLHQDTIVELTGYRRKSKQTTQLIRMGIPHILNRNGIPKVLKEVLAMRSETQTQHRAVWKPKVKI